VNGDHLVETARRQAPKATRDHALEAATVAPASCLGRAITPHWRARHPFEAALRLSNQSVRGDAAGWSLAFTTLVEA
jgi:hypothetical protein